MCNTEQDEEAFISKFLAVSHRERTYDNVADSQINESQFSFLPF